VAIPILTFMLAQSLLLISEYLPALLNAREAWERVRAMLHDPAPVLDKVNAKGLPALSNEITLRNVTAAGLEEVSATVKRGSYVAFVGRGGSGTAEIMKLLLRFHDPASGAALFDTHDLKSVTQTSIRARIGVVLRTNFMFNASVRENVRLTNPTTTEEKLGDLMHSSGVAAMAASLPQGMDTVIGENGHPIPAELQQRIAIARALLKNPDVLLLDNATSALDASAEKSVNETLRRLAKGRTLISVTHRLTSAADADLIYVFDGGRIVEQGSHAELIAADGVYGELWLKQAGFRFSADGSHVDVDAQRLKMFPAFHDIDEKILAELAPFFSTATYPPERDIVCQGDPCDQDCILVRGEAEVIRHDAETGESIVTGTLEDGDSFEESGLITRLSRTATVRARGVCTCISLERGQFESLIDRYPELRQEGSSTAVALKDAAGSRQS
jgi:ATP-binding cassette subfamily B protein